MVFSCECGQKSKAVRITYMEPLFFKFGNDVVQVATANIVNTSGLKVENAEFFAYWEVDRFRFGESH